MLKVRYSLSPPSAIYIKAEIERITTSKARLPMQIYIQKLRERTHSLYCFNKTILKQTHHSRRNDPLPRPRNPHPRRARGGMDEHQYSQIHALQALDDPRAPRGREEGEKVVSEGDRS